MYWSLPSFVLGFHGCDFSVAESVFAGNTFLKPSQNNYDWLGHGVYFWENDPERALLFAETNTTRHQSKIKMPAVIGAVIDLGHCFNLMEASTLQLLKDGYQIMHTNYQECIKPFAIFEFHESRIKTPRVNYRSARRRRTARLGSV
jgi:hypothetical protein